MVCMMRREGERVKRIQLILAGMLLTILLAACGSDSRLENAGASTMILDGKKITVLTVTDFDADVYSESGLRRMANDEVKAYNDAVGEKRVTFQDLKVRDGMAFLTMTYKSAEDYASFNNVTFRNGLLSDAGLPAETRVLSTDGKLLTTVGTLLEDPENEWKFVALEEPMEVYTDGTAAYLAGEAEFQEDHVAVGAGLDPDGFLAEPCYIVYN